MMLPDAIDQEREQRLQRRERKRPDRQRNDRRQRRHSRGHRTTSDVIKHPRADGVFVLEQRRQLSIG
jgi:hypothetical protein